MKLDVTTDDVLAGDLSYLADYQSVVLVGAPLSLQLKVNEFCHSRGIPFIVADSYGLFAWTFADFGPNFAIHDKNGEFAKEVFVGKITNDKVAQVTTLDDQFHDLGMSGPVKRKLKYRNWRYS